MADDPAKARYDVVNEQSLPRTEAGRRLLAQFDGRPGPLEVRDILAIEVEAAASPVDGGLYRHLEGLILGLRTYGYLVRPGDKPSSGDAMLHRDAVLDALHAALSQSPDPGFKVSDYDPEGSDAHD